MATQAAVSKKQIATVLCGCTSEFQDKMYGKGRRIANRKNKAPTPTATCTVCGRQHQVSEGAFR